MHTKQNLPNYEDIESALEDVKTLVSPSQMHGLLCGVICLGGAELDEQATVAIAIGVDQEELHISPEQSQALKALLDYSYQELSQMEFDFQLLLPDDETSLRERSEELGRWCYGFLLGLESSSDQDDLNDRLSADGYDTILKLNEISQIDYDHLSYNEHDENAFMEITEYVRMAILTLYSEMHKGMTISKTIH